MNLYTYSLILLILISNFCLFSMDKPIGNKPSIVRLHDRVINAVCQGDLAQLQNIHRANPNLSFQYISLQAMPLIHVAATTHNASIMDYLITQVGLNPQTPFQGQTILHTAAVHGNVEVSRLLIERNLLDKNVLDKQQKSPLDLAKLYKKLELVSYLIWAKMNPTVKLAQSVSKEEIKDEERDCAICYVTKKSTDFTTLSCSHEYCTTCLQQVIKQAIVTGNLNGLRCPTPKCPTSFEVTVTNTLLHDSETRNKLNEIQFQTWLANQSKYVGCPKPNCPSGFINERTDQFTVKCDSCEEIYCAQCLKQHSARLTCLQATEENKKISANKEEQEKESQKWKERYTRPCPACKASIQKNEGCNHMSCAKCKHQFCWQCMNPWKQRGHGPFGCSLAAPAPAAAGIPAQRIIEEITPFNEHLHFIRDPLGFKDLVDDELQHAQFMERFKRLSCEQQDEWGARVTNQLDNPLSLMEDRSETWLSALELVEGHRGHRQSPDSDDENPFVGSGAIDMRRLPLGLFLAMLLGAQHGHPHHHGQ